MVGSGGGLSGAGLSSGGVHQREVHRRWGPVEGGAGFGVSLLGTKTEQNKNKMKREISKN